MDLDDPTMNNRAIRNLLDKRPNLTYNYGNNKTKVQAINADLNNKEFDVLLLASDDMLPKINNYDQVIIVEMEKHHPDMDGCLHFNDGRQGKKLNTLVVMGVNLYKQFGYIYHPSYQSLYCDNEFMDVTNNIGKSVYIDQIIISHEWINICGGTKDALYIRNDKPVMKDKSNYITRKAIGFPT